LIEESCWLLFISMTESFLQKKLEYAITFFIKHDILIKSNCLQNSNNDHHILK